MPNVGGARRSTRRLPVRKVRNCTRETSVTTPRSLQKPPVPFWGARPFSGTLLPALTCAIACVVLSCPLPIVLLMQGGVNGPSVLRGLLLDVLATRRPGRTTAAGGAGTETEQKSRREPRVRQGREGKRGEREKQKRAPLTYSITAWGADCARTGVAEVDQSRGVAVFTLRVLLVFRMPPGELEPRSAVSLANQANYCREKERKGTLPWTSVRYAW